MEIELLEAENFQSYEKLSLGLSNLGLVLVEGNNQDQGGSNGAGKSTIFDAIHWTAYGVTSRLGARTSGVVREDSEHNPVGNTRGFLRIKSGDRIVEIERYQAHQTFKNKVLLKVNGVDLTMGSNKETQERIDSTLRVDEGTFSSVVMFPQGVSGFASLTDAQQKEVLERVLNLERFTEAQVNAAVKQKKLVFARQQVRARLSMHDQNIREDQLILAQLKEKHSLFDADKRLKISEARTKRDNHANAKPALNTAVFAEANDLKSRLGSVEDFIELSKRISERINSLTAESAKHAQSGIMLQKTLKNLPEVFIDFQDTLPDLHNTLASAESGLNAIEKAIHACERDVARLAAKSASKESATDCSECGTPLTPEMKSRIFGDVDLQCATARVELQGLEEKRAECLCVIDTTRKKIEVLQSREAFVENESLRQEIMRISLLKKKTDDELDRTKKMRDESAAQINEALGLKTRLAEIDREILNHSLAEERWKSIAEHLDAEIVRAEESDSPYADMITNQEEKIRRAQSTGKTLTSVSSALDKELKGFEFWAEGFGNRGVKSLMLDTVTPYLNERANFYMHFLTNGAGSVMFNTTSALASGETRDKFNVEVTYNNGAGSYKSISGGEQQRADIAIIFALGDLGSSRAHAPIKLRLLDEPFDNLDAQGKELVVELVRRYIVPRSGTVLVMSHDESMKSLFENHILVTKKNGISTVKA